MSETAFKGRNCILATLFIGVFNLVCVSGSQWTQIKSLPKSSNAIESVLFFNTNEGIVLSRENILRTADGGATWRVVLNESSVVYRRIIRDGADGAIIVAVESRDSSNSFGSASGAQKVQPAIFTSSNKGNNWEKNEINFGSVDRRTPGLQSFNDLCTDINGAMWIITDGGIIEAQIANRILTMVSFFQTRDAVVDVSCNESGTVALGAVGTLFKHSGVWSSLSLPGSSDLSWTRLIQSNGNYWVVGNRSIGRPNEEHGTHQGVLLYSPDNGSTWEDKTPSGNNGLTDIQFLGNNGWLTGFDGHIYFSKDSGKRWSYSLSPSQNDLLTVFIVDSERAWIAGDRATLLKFEN